MDSDTTLYKYRSFSADSLSMLINREFFFSDPRHFNDPYDCQISIIDAIRAAIEQAEVIGTRESVKSKLEKLQKTQPCF